MDVSVIIVNYNTKELTRNCLNSVFEQTKNIEFEVIVSDNGSIDGSVEMIKTEFPQVILIENNANLGFGTANNRGLSKASGKYIFYLNSGTVLVNNAVKYFFDYWKSNLNNRIGGLGCVLINSDDTEIHSGGKFPTYKSICREQLSWLKTHLIKTFFRIFHLQNMYRFLKRKYGNNEIYKVPFSDIEYITGADLFLKNNKYAEFDEDFFLYYEETDLQLKLVKNNFTMLLIDSPKIVHLEKKNDNLFSISTMSNIYCQISAIKYVTKNIKRKPYLLKLLISLDWLNPYIKPLVNKIRERYK